jgi:hypothetical protein
MAEERKEKGGAGKDDTRVESREQREQAERDQRAQNRRNVIPA